MSGTFEALAAFALGAIPGVIVLELLEYGRPQLRERSGARAVASYLILSLFVWGLAIVCLCADDRLAEVLDSSEKKGQDRVDAYIALSWRLLAAAIALGIAVRVILWGGARIALHIESTRREGNSRAFGWIGDIVVRAFSFAFAWDRLLERLNRTAKPQIVHVRLRDGGEIYGVMAEGGSADFHADGSGLVLDAELLHSQGRLIQIPNSTGLYVPSEAVASIAFAEYEDPEATGTIDSDEQTAAG